MDCTLVLYGSSNNSQTHVNLDYPLVLSGGRGLGLRHGQYRRFGEATPFSNLFVTMLHALGLPMEAFADRTGELTEALA